MIRKVFTCLTTVVLTFSMMAALLSAPGGFAAKAAEEMPGETPTVSTPEGDPTDPAPDTDAAEGAAEPAPDTDAADNAAYRQSTEGWSLAGSEQKAVLSPAALAVGDSVQFAVSIPADALYELRLLYRCTATQDAGLKLLIDGVSPFSEAQRLTFPAMWVNDGEAQKDSAGNESTPKQTLSDENAHGVARDYTGRQEDPYRFALTAGVHTITLTVEQGELWLEEAALVPPEQPGAYQAPQDSTGVKDYIIFEGEDAVLKNDRSLIPLSDSSNAAVHPSSPEITRLNYIGGSNWASPGSAITWNFHVETAGYYTIDFLFRQNELLGGVVFRHLLIDGQTPFEEAKRIKFGYKSGWQSLTFGGEDNPYRIYLEAGPHTLTLMATPGPMADVYADMQKVTAQMGDLYVDITMITGETVDIYRSYELFNQIPGFNDTLDQIIEQLSTIADNMEAMQEAESGSTVSTIRNAERVVRQMRDNPYSAHRYKTEFYDSYTNLSALMGTMTDMPLCIDQIILAGDAAEVPDTSPSFFDRVLFSVRRFLITFSSDYQTVSDSEEGQEALTLWIRWGRDQASVLNSLIQDDFVRETGIPVKVELVNATLIQAMLSGKGPDCMLQMTRTDPVNLAMRGALMDLSGFPGLEKTLARFSEGAEEPYRYDGGLYALPDTQNFFLMFMRTDIMKSMGLEQPETWEEFIHVAMLLQRSNLQVSLPYTRITDSGSANSGVGGMSLYPSLLAQSGLSLYYSDHSGCTIAEQLQAEVFGEWIGWYTKYKLPVITDFFNRFRIGSAPIGIANYTMYTQLKAAAPEIADRWVATQIPGTLRKDGVIDHSSAGSGTGCAITTLSKNPENAWKFLQWWTSADTQLKYSENLESVLGPLGRVATSNLEALASMDWDADMKQLLSTVQAGVKEIPEVPGGYYTARGIDQAYWAVVEQGETPINALTKWCDAINREIQRKTAEYAK